MLHASKQSSLTVRHEGRVVGAFQVDSFEVADSLDDEAILEELIATASFRTSIIRDPDAHGPYRASAISASCYQRVSTREAADVVLGFHEGVALDDDSAAGVQRLVLRPIEDATAAFVLHAPSDTKHPLSWIYSAYEELILINSDAQEVTAVRMLDD